MVVASHLGRDVSPIAWHKLGGDNGDFVEDHGGRIVRGERGEVDGGEREEVRHELDAVVRLHQKRLGLEQRLKVLCITEDDEDDDGDGDVMVVVAAGKK